MFIELSAHMVDVECIIAVAPRPENTSMVYISSGAEFRTDESPAAVMQKIHESYQRAPVYRDPGQL
jgi:hypothetical protein